jgi:hypothetical protein
MDDGHVSLSPLRILIGLLNMVYFTSSINNQINIAGQKKNVQQGE